MCLYYRVLASIKCALQERFPVPWDKMHALHSPAARRNPARAIRRGAASTQTPLGGPPSRTICSAAAKGVPFLGRGGTSAAVDDLDRDGSAPLTRAEALTGFVASIVVSSGVLLSEVSRARADADAGPGGLGVVDDLLADCPSTPTCVSSQDDRPYSFMEPWAYDGPWERAMARLRSYVELNGAKVVAFSPRYLRVEYEAANPLQASVDDVEFYFTPGDALVQFRCARRRGVTDLGAGRKRMDSIRLALKFEPIPVLRNRRRAFVFGESPLDSFGPSFGKMDPSVIYGDKDPMSPPFETPSGALRERYGNGDGGADRPAWWGKPLAVAGGFADYRS
eukprot:jgi/Undpi1/3212/HiC_scaffold_15.g06586.m1